MLKLGPFIRLKIFDLSSDDIFLEVIELNRLLFYCN